jgi:phosphotransferase system HPr-like phosphotransfer protein
MQEINIVLRDIQSIRDFVKEVVSLEYDVDLVQGRYIVDAKSIMGIFALDIASPIKVVADTNDATPFFKAIEKYVVK